MIMITLRFDIKNPKTWGLKDFAVIVSSYELASVSGAYHGHYRNPFQLILGSISAGVLICEILEVAYPRATPREALSSLVTPLYSTQSLF
jgi:hypothetical protein